MIQKLKLTFKRFCDYASLASLIATFKHLSCKDFLNFQIKSDINIVGCQTDDICKSYNKIKAIICIWQNSGCYFKDNYEVRQFRKWL